MHYGNENCRRFLMFKNIMYSNIISFAIYILFNNNNNIIHITVTIKPEIK